MSGEQPQAEGEERTPTPEEFAAAMVHRLGRIPVRDVLLQTMATLADMSSIRLGFGPEGDEVKDLAQARTAIEALRALVQVAEDELGAAQVRPFKEPLAQLQLAYAHVVESGGPPPEGEPRQSQPDQAPPSGPPPTQPPGPDPASKLWVPPGSR